MVRTRVVYPYSGWAEAAEAGELFLGMSLLLETVERGAVEVEVLEVRSVEVRRWAGDRPEVTSMLEFMVSAVLRDWSHVPVDLEFRADAPGQADEQWELRGAAFERGRARGVMELRSVVRIPAHLMDAFEDVPLQRGVRNS
jgi:hypothetical protein